MSDLLIGRPVIARNESDSSIHDPARAKALGFRGSAVAGTFHLDCFAPLMLEVYGEDWWRRGGISLYFQNIVVSGEPVEAVVRRPSAPGAMTQVHARRADDPSITVASGTASLNDHTHHDLLKRDLRLCDQSKLRLLKGIHPGAPIAEKVHVVESKKQDAQIASGGINQDMPFYHGSSPWGGPVASISQAASLMVRLSHENGFLHLAPDSDKAEQMFGACQLVHVNGPVFLDRYYTVRGTVVGVGESPKTEYCWWDATAHDEGGEEVARVRHLLRFIKTGSPLYPELRAAA
jgi:hypothetical protein